MADNSVIEDIKVMRREDILFNNKIAEHKLRMEEGRFRVEEHKMKLEESKFRMKDAMARSAEMMKDKILQRVIKSIDFIDSIHDKKNIDVVVKKKYIETVESLLLMGHQDSSMEI
jgi:hypothetical protein